MWTGGGRWKERKKESSRMCFWRDPIPLFFSNCVCLILRHFRQMLSLRHLRWKFRTSWDVFNHRLTNQTSFLCSQQKPHFNSISLFSRSSKSYPLNLAFSFTPIFQAQIPCPLSVSGKTNRYPFHIMIGFVRSLGPKAPILILIM